MIEMFHGYTYSGHPVAAAAGLATMDVYDEEGTFEQAAALESHFEDLLHSFDNHRHVVDVRNFGLMGAIEMAPRAGAAGARGGEVHKKCFWDENLVVRNGMDTLQFSPFPEFQARRNGAVLCRPSSGTRLDRVSSIRSKLMSARPARKLTPRRSLATSSTTRMSLTTTGRSRSATRPAARVTRQVAMASQSHGRKSAIAAAQAAFPEWRNTPPAKRARVMFRFKQLLEEHADEIAAAITDEHGKVFDDAMGEFGRGVEVVDYACGIPELLKGEYSKNVGPGIDSWSDFQPLGVVAGITPVQFSGDGPDVDVPDGDRLRQHLCAQAVRKRSDRLVCWRRDCCKRQVCPTACSISSTATRKPSIRC